MSGAIALDEGERVAASRKVTYFYTLEIAAPGDLHLTNQRFIFEPSSFLDRSLGAPGFAIGLERVELVEYATTRRPRLVVKADGQRHVFLDSSVSEEFLQTALRLLSHRLSDPPTTAFGESGKVEPLPVVRVLRDAQLVSTVPLMGTPFMIGRGSRNTLVLAAASVSRQHAMILERSGGYAIQDLDSRNGVFLNGARVVRGDLQEGDEIRIGRFQLVFGKQAGDAAGEAPPATRIVDTADAGLIDELTLVETPLPEDVLRLSDFDLEEVEVRVKYRGRTVTRSFEVRGPSGHVDLESWGRDAVTIRVKTRDRTIERTVEIDDDDPI